MYTSQSQPSYYNNKKLTCISHTHPWELFTYATTSDFHRPRPHVGRILEPMFINSSSCEKQHGSCRREACCSCSWPPFVVADDNLCATMRLVVYLAPPQNAPADTGVRCDTEARLKEWQESSYIKNLYITHAISMWFQANCNGANAVTLAVLVAGTYDRVCQESELEFGRLQSCSSNCNWSWWPDRSGGGSGQHSAEMTAPAIIITIPTRCRSEPVIVEIVGHEPVEILSVCKSNRLHVHFLLFSFIKLGYIL